MSYRSRSFRPVLWRYRWLVVACCLACATWVAIGELRPPPEPTSPVLVTARDVPAGTVLTAADVRLDAAPRAPGGAVPLEAAVGATVTIGLPEGVAVVETMLLGPGLAESAPEGWVVVPAPLADPVLADLIRVGDRIDLYLTAADTGGRLSEAELVATGALVLARASPDAGETSWLGGPASSSTGVVVVAVRPSDAPGMAGASGFGPFRAVLSAV
ncbi:SAF domain-containing protein [Pseudactinotalea sp.]|uniref:SAF domain-containing protein n=1 Tax=Pseudactinotalea sp. TaxID=1926260 RepID=UPI003B3A939C